MNKISVIVPVYNVAAYLPECLDSIVGQTYRNLEILLVDDGSTDHSGAICDAYAQKDSRIRVFHKKNGGAASARNLALKEATGEYLAFVDSDDTLEADAYAYMLEKLEELDADVVQCSYREWYPERVQDHVIFPQEIAFDTQEYLVRFTKDWTCGLLWDKLYRRSLFDGVFFEEGHCIDDEFFTYQGILNAKKILHLPKVVYNYRKRRSSVTISEHTQKKMVLDRLDYLVKRRRIVLAKFPELKQAFDYHYLSMLVILAGDSAATADSIRVTKQQLRNYAREKRMCKMEFTLLKKLLWLYFSGEEKILARKNNMQSSGQCDEYFE